MAEKKRKRHGEENNARPSKRVATEQPSAEVIKVSFVPDEDEWTPVVASTPGLSFPSHLPLKPYTKRRKSNTTSTGKSPITNSEHLLHTSAHPSIDYTGQEEVGGGTEGLLSHYIGVYDPRSGDLQLMRARKLVLRGSPRSSPTELEQAAKGANDRSARTALGLAFGTKKSKRALQNLTKNAISPSKKGLPAAEGSQPTLDPVAAAVISSMAIAAPSGTSREDLQAAIDEAKPRPTPNTAAEAPMDVYPIDQLVGPGILRQLAVKDWQDAVEHKEEILTKSRFVSHRIQQIVSEGDVRRIKTLKYLLLLIEWYTMLVPGPKGKGRKIPDRAQLHDKLGKWGGELVDSVGRRFADNGDNNNTNNNGKMTLNSWHLDNLITHICALCITVEPENYLTDMYDIREDLKLDNKSVRKYFREIGCRIVAPTDKERARWGLATKAEAASHHVAKLRLPLEFPKMKVVRQPKGRR
ncbi:MAG: hypothetical protein LQ349_003398 [Xanthoria aureola]|nr:MAG: hypothetical protein LQ349_003398 [Xanthoria aureola]